MSSWEIPGKVPCVASQESQSSRGAEDLAHWCFPISPNPISPNPRVRVVFVCGYLIVLLGLGLGLGSGLGLWLGSRLWLGWGLGLGLGSGLRHDALSTSVSNNFVHVRQIGIR